METVLIDADYLSYVIPYKMRDVSTDYKDFCKEVDRHIEFILEQNNTNQYICFISDSKNFRNKIAKTKTYKGQRPTKKPFMYHEIRNYLIDHHEAVMVDQLEADDVVLMYNNRLKQNYETVIASPDKDLQQIPGKFYNPQKDEFNEVTPKQAKYNFWLSMLVGDSADNIPGVKNIGPKKGSNLLNNDNTGEAWRNQVLSAYIDAYGIKKGINQFTENFNLLYILRDPEEWVEPGEPVKFEKKEHQEQINEMEI